MKRFLGSLVSFALIAALSLLSVEGYAKSWKLYDNFNYSGPPDPNRWIIHGHPHVAEISIEDGRAKFDHNAGYPEHSSWLTIKKGMEKIKGIRATVTVQSCTGDVRGRVGGPIAEVEDGWVWSKLALQGGIAEPRIYGELCMWEDGKAYGWLYNICWGLFRTPLDIIGNTFTITMIISKTEVTYEVSGLGEITYKLPEKLSPTDVYSLGLSTRSHLGEGPCVVYFDDVYVLK